MNRNTRSWRDLSDDPNDPAVRQYLRETLLKARRGRIEFTNDFLEDFVQGYEVLDIGMVAHTVDRTHDPQWRHNIIRNAAARAVGIDILEEPVNQLCARGYDVRLVDATSSADLGERFTRVVIGDVIEHVDNPVSLLRFAARHLAPSGRILCSTPNPFFIGNIVSGKRDGLFLTNAEHVSWITPTMALELAERAGVILHSYWHAQTTGRTPLRKLAYWILGFARQLDSEIFAGSFYYVFELRTPLQE